MHEVFWQTACMLCHLGVRIFPTAWGSKVPFHRADWRAIATNDINRIPHVFPSGTHTGIAAVLGPSSGIMDVESDSELGAATWIDIHTRHAEVPTVAYQSKRGVHRWYQWSPALAALGKTIPKVRGLEVRLGTDEKGIYSVVPPSLHPDGEWYRWLPGRSPWEIAVAPLPQHLLEAFSEVVRTQSKSVCEVTQQGDDWVPEPGQRHQYLLRLSHLLAGTLRLPRDLVHEMMMPLSEYIGKVSDLGQEGAEKELKDMISTVIRPQTPESILKEIDFGAMYETANTILQQQKVEQAKIKESESMPHDIFPSWMEHVSQCGKACQVPRHFTLMASLTAASSAIGASAQISMGVNAAPMGVQLYTLGVGESGSGKSRALNKMTEAVNGLPNFLTDATTEALRAVLCANPRGALLKIVEGKQFTRMLGRYNANGGGTPDNSVLLEAWSGDPIIVARQDVRKSFRIEHPFLSVVAAIQPHNLGSFSADDILEGLMQRMCVYSGDDVPDTIDPRAGTEFHKGTQFFAQTLARLRTLRPYVNDKGMIPLYGQENATANLWPLQLVLNDEAQKTWVEYAKWKRSEEVMGLWVDGHPFRNDLVRHAEIALRIAGIFRLWWHAEDETRWEQFSLHGLRAIWVEKPFLDRAIRLMEWLWQEKQRLMLDLADDRFARAMSHGNLKVDSSLKEMLRRLAQRRSTVLTNRLKGKQEWSLRDYYRHLRMSVDEANQELALFQQHGFVTLAGNRSHAVNSLTTSLYTFVQQAVKRIRPD